MSAFIEEIEEAPLRDLFRHWCRARPVSGGVPSRRAMDPLDLPRALLPYMFIYEHVEGRFRCRLSGTALRIVFGRDETGYWLDELVNPGAVPRRHSLFRETLATGLPVYYRGYLVAPGREWRSFSRLLLPVATADTADQVMGAVLFQTNVSGPAQGAGEDGAIEVFKASDEDCAGATR